jgi:copper chaperone
MRERFSVPEVSCGHCKASIEGAFAPVAGIQEAVVDLETKEVTVEFDAAVTDRATVVRTIESAGYAVAG